MIHFLLYIFSLSILQTIRSHKLTLTCVFLIENLLYLHLHFFLTKRNLGRDIFGRSCQSEKSPSNRLSHKLLGNFPAAFEILGNFCHLRQLLKFSASFDLIFFCDSFQLSKETSAQLTVLFILLSECVESRTAPITNASLVLHACP